MRFIKNTFRNVWLVKQPGERLDGERGHGLMIGLKQQNLDDVTDLSLILVINLMRIRRKI